MYGLSLIYFTILIITSFKSAQAKQSFEISYGEGYIYPYPDKCVQILNTFASYASNFTMCSIIHARPIRLCEECIENYVQFQGKYKELITTVVNGTSCGSTFISNDRLDAVLEYHNSILSIWNKGNCNACYEWPDDEPTLSNKTKHFNKLYNDAMDCITSHWKPNSEEVCEKCMQSYLLLDNYYQTLSTDNIGLDTVCMDIVDSMNATRAIWSKSLNCCRLRRSPELVFLCCTGIISFLPLLYYLAVRYCGPIRDLPNVLRQSRFKQILLRSDSGVIN